jgi:hypothetical protein
MQKQQAEHSEELQAKQVESALANSVRAAQNLDEVIDYTVDDVSTFRPQHEDYENADVPLDEPDISASAIDVTKEKVEIRVNAGIDDMTFGREVLDPGDREKGLDPVLGNLRYYTFEEGHRYMVPVALALHLEEIGYLYHLDDHSCCRSTETR